MSVESNEKIIFVDCFDTILKREVKSDVVFRQWSAKLSEKYELNQKEIYKLYKKITFKLSLKKTLTKNIFIERFDTVIEELFNRVSKDKDIKKADFLKDAKEIYRSCESEILYLNPEVVKMLNDKSEEGKKIYVVSDFYCGSDFIESLLKDKGVSDLFTSVYSSCDYDKEKATGKLYKKIIKELNASKKNVTMYGDNLWSDVLMARKCGLHSKWVRKNFVYKVHYLINKEWDKIFKLYENNSNYSNHAFPLYLFTKRLFDSLITDNVKDILFMSREGQFLKKLFDRYLEIRKEMGFETADIKSQYFYGSRNSIMKASGKNLEEETFDFLFRFFPFMSARAFMFSIGFSDEQIEEVKNNCKININKNILFFQSSKEFKILKNNDVFKKIYTGNRDTQAGVLKNYIDSFNVDTSKEVLTFVDIGYHGTMQDLIFKYLGNEVKMKGYFIKSRAISSDMNMKVGLLSDNNNKKLFGHKINKYDAFNYEQILRADHGRCLGYKMENGQAVPMIDTQLHDGELYDKYVRELQNQIFNKFELIARKALAQEKGVDEICVAYYYYMVKNKSEADFNWILDMQDTHHDDFGIVGYSGTMIGRGLRKFAFKLNDIQFVARNRSYIKKLIRKAQKLC